MSVKSERRAWYAANVEDRPGLDARDPAYMAWVKRANVHMVSLCIPGTAELLDPAIAAAPIAAKSIARATSATDANDRATYDAMVDAMRYRIADHMGFPGEIWDDYWVSGSPSLELCKGSWRVARKHLTEEMHRAMDAGVWRWVTYSDFKTEQVAERAYMAANFAALADDAAADWADADMSVF